MFHLQVTSTRDNFQVESVQYKNTSITVLDLGGTSRQSRRAQLAQLARPYVSGTTRIIFVVDSADRHWDDVMRWECLGRQGVGTHTHM